MQPTQKKMLVIAEVSRPGGFLSREIALFDYNHRVDVTKEVKMINCLLKQYPDAYVELKIEEMECHLPIIDEITE